MSIVLLHAVWEFEPGLFKFHGKPFNCKPTPLSLLRYMIEHRLRTVFGINDFLSLRGDDHEMIQQPTITRHVSELRTVLRNVAQSIGAAPDIIDDPLPYTNKSDWRFLLPRE